MKKASSSSSSTSRSASFCVSAQRSKNPFQTQDIFKENSMMMKMKDSDIRKKLRASKVNSKNDILNVLETCLKEMYELLQREKRLHEAKSDDEIVEVTFFFFGFF